MDKKSYNDIMKAYYDHRAPHHDDYMSFSNQDNFEKNLHPILEIIHPHLENKNILELACGTGNWTGTIATLGNKVTAVDSSEKSLEIARDKLTDFQNTIFHLNDIYKLDSLNNKYDTILAADWWSHMPKSEIPSFLINMNQLLNSDGVLIFIDMTFKKFFQDVESYFDKEDNQIFPRTLPNGSKYEVIKNFPTKEELFTYLPNGYIPQYYQFDSLERWMVIYSKK